MNPICSLHIDSLKSLEVLSKALASAIKPGLFIGLSGPLGAGKTELVRKLLRNLGVVESVTSPTFVLETQYEVIIDDVASVFYHWDLYRLGSQEFVEDLVDRRRDENAITFIEWPEKVPEVQSLLDLELVLAFGQQSEQPDAELELQDSARKIGVFANEPVGKEGLVSALLQAIPDSLIIG